MGDKTGITWTDATRSCSRCGVAKSASEFPVDRSRPLGFGYECNACFVNSMSDLFHEELTNEEIAAVFGVMAAAPRHTFQVLTKRARRMREWFEWIERLHPDARGKAFRLCDEAAEHFFDASHRALDKIRIRTDIAWPLPNVWLGVSAEDQRAADERVPDLLATPAAVRFVSYEPAIGPVDFSRVVQKTRIGVDVIFDSLRPNLAAAWCGAPSDGLDWVIVGGESGPGARPFDLAWARDVVRQCADAGVACFVKQLGAKPFADRFAPFPLALDPTHGGDMREWPAYLRVREFPEVRS